MMVTKKPDNEIGAEVVCPHCGQPHPVEYGEKILQDGSRVPSKLLAFYKCDDKAYLVAIDGTIVDDRLLPKG